jgi:transposase
MAKSHTRKPYARYAPEFRQQMIELARAGRPVKQLAREFGCCAWTIRGWIRKAEQDAGQGRGGLTTAEREELARLRRENKRLKLEREILSKATAWFAQETAPNTKNSTDS